MHTHTRARLFIDERISLYFEIGKKAVFSGFNMKKIRKCKIYFVPKIEFASIFSKTFVMIISVITVKPKETGVLTLGDPCCAQARLTSKVQFL